MSSTLCSARSRASRASVRLSSAREEAFATSLTAALVRPAIASSVPIAETRSSAESLVSRTSSWVSEVPPLV